MPRLNQPVLRSVPPLPGPKASPLFFGVRRQRIAFDEHFVFESNTISKLDARIQAERAARKAGWPVIGVVYDYQYP